MLNERTWHGNMALNTLAVTSEQQLQGGIKVMHIVSLFIIPVTQMMIWELNTIRPDKMWSFWYEFKCSSKHEPWSLQTNAHRQNVFSFCSKASILLTATSMLDEPQPENFWNLPGSAMWKELGVRRLGHLANCLSDQSEGCSSSNQSESWWWHGHKQERLTTDLESL